MLTYEPNETLAFLQTYIMNLREKLAAAEAKIEELQGTLAAWEAKDDAEDAKKESWIEEFEQP